METVGSGLSPRVSVHDFTPFRSRLPWLGADLQTLRSSIRGHKYYAAQSGRHLVPITSHDERGMSEHISVARTDPDHAANGKALLLVHGLGGSEDSIYMIAAAAYFSALGYTVFRMNYRGVGPSRLTSKPPYSGGLTGDLIQALKFLETEDFPDGIHVMGFSLGGHLTLKMLTENAQTPSVRSCVTVSAPLDLSVTMRTLEKMRNAFYLRYLAANMRRDLAETRDHIRVIHDPATFTSVRQFDEHVIAPVFGYRGAEDYYARVSCKPDLHKITCPVLAVHADNDPWIPARCYYEANWPDGRPAGALITRGGGHVGFHTKGDKRPWYLTAAARFFDQYA